MLGGCGTWGEAMGPAKHLLFCLLLALVPAIAGCSCGTGVDDGEESEDPSSSASTGATPLPCGIDCAGLPAGPCKVGVCNEGQEIGPLYECVIVAAPAGSTCDDGVFCTMEDVCDGAGSCQGGPTNDCGEPHGACDAVLCYEDTKSCSVTPASDGTLCTPDDLCQVDGVCQTGECVGEEKDCSYSPLWECNDVECDPATGACVGTPDEFKDNLPCELTGDICKVGKACQNGTCGGGTEKDCSELDVECTVGECEDGTGLCVPVAGPAVAGLPCTDGVSACQVGECTVAGACEATDSPNGADCNDHDSCTAADQCTAGACADTSPVANCSYYLRQGFETCPSGWTFGGDWECGEPSGVGPAAAHAGTGVIATKLDGVYTVNQAFATSYAQSPAIDLGDSTAPRLSFWAWDHTEGGTYDGWNVQISTNGGTSFDPITTVTPAYPLTIATQSAWGGNHAGDGWQPYSADLTAFAGQSVIIRFAFRSDGATVYPGVYVDDVVVAEPVQDPLYVTSESPLGTAYSGGAMVVPMARVGGAADAVWSIVPGGVNDAWLTIDPATGVLSGTPTPAQVGPVKVTVRVEQPTLPSNYDDKTFALKVEPALYYTSFEGACPSGWTLTGDWECGVPSVVGPASAYNGTQCIATQIDANYTDSQTFAGATATSPNIDLSGILAPVLRFRMWLDTEGGTSDGVNLKVSNDGGANYATISTVTPAYNSTISGQPAWGGHQQALGWQLVQVDLSAFAGEVISLRFAFRSDSTESYAGVYIDDVFVN